MILLGLFNGQERGDFLKEFLTCSSQCIKSPWIGIGGFRMRVFDEDNRRKDTSCINK